MTRRIVLGILSSTIVRPPLFNAAYLYGEIDVARWLEFQEAWNPFAEKLNGGVYDAKAWAKVCDKFRALGACDKPKKSKVGL